MQLTDVESKKSDDICYSILSCRENKNTSFQDRSVQRVLPPGQERPPEADRKPAAGADTQGLQEKVVIEVGREKNLDFFSTFINEVLILFVILLKYFMKLFFFFLFPLSGRSRRMSSCVVFVIASE